MAECAKDVYRPRRPRETPFYRLVEEHYERFEQVYPGRYEDRYGFFRPVIRETVYKSSAAATRARPFLDALAAGAIGGSRLPPMG